MSSIPFRSRARASLEVLRAEAVEERDTVIAERCLAGEDPWDFMDELPTVDQLVVLLLRAEAIEQDDGRAPSAPGDFRMLRQIALDHPALSTAVWHLLGDARRVRWAP